MVGAAVAMVIPSMHEKPFIDVLTHDDWNISQNWVNRISRNHNDENAKLSLIEVYWIFFLQVISYTSNRNSYLNVISLIENYRHIICISNLLNYLPFTRIYVYRLCRFIDTSIIMMSQRRCNARDSQSQASIFLQCTIRRLLVRQFSCRFCLCNVSKQINSCHNRI